MTEPVERVRVDLGERSYTVSVGHGLLGCLEEHLPRHNWRKAAIVTDDVVGPLYASTTSSRLCAAGLDTVLLEVPAGEASKTAARALELVDSLISSGVSRSDAVFALGGGVIGDLAGFAASIFKRGVDLVQVPTSLMAQVDSAIGGKTAVNVPAAKNQVGSFHQPVAVVCDVTLLGTLPPEEFVSGLAEVAKYSVLTGREWGREFPESAPAARERNYSGLLGLIADCAREKADLVAADERDMGLRSLLNYGHTLGHALEAAGGYGGTYRHGEAVSVGMVFAALVAQELEIAAPGLAERHRSLLDALGLPTAPRRPAPSFDDLASRMAHDKKNAGENTMVLLELEGKPVIRRGIDPALLRHCYRVQSGSAAE